MNPTTIQLAELPGPLALADTVTHKAMVALYWKLFSESLGPDTATEVALSIKSAANWDAMQGLEWMCFECVKVFEMPAHESLTSDEKAHRILLTLLMLACEAKGMSSKKQESLFNKHQRLLRLAESGVGAASILALVSTLKGILTDSASAEYLSICNHRGFSSEDAQSNWLAAKGRSASRRQ